MSDATTAVAETAPATTDAKPTKAKRVRTVTKYGRDKLKLVEYSVPDSKLETVPTDWTLFVHKELGKDDFQDPLDYYTWSEESLLPQIAAECETKKADLAKVGSKEERTALLDVKSEMSSMMAAFQATLLANADSKALKAAMESELGNMAETLMQSLAEQRAKEETAAADA